MNKQELVNAIAGKVEGLSKKQVGEILDVTLEEISDTLASGDSVKLVGFGNFEVRKRAARKGVNPSLLKQLKEQGVDENAAKAQAQVDIPESKAPAFKPSKSLKDKVK